MSENTQEKRQGLKRRLMHAIFRGEAQFTGWHTDPVKMMSKFRKATRKMSGPAFKAANFTHRKEFFLEP